jgi:hypothetical protein
MELAAFYQCHRNKRAFTHSLASFRRHYPHVKAIEESTNEKVVSHFVESNYLYIINNGGDTELKEIAKSYYSNYYEYSNKFNTRILVCTSSTPKELAIKYLSTWLLRINDCLKIVPPSCKFLLNLEDDVFVMNSVTIDDLKYDINGCNTNAVFISNRINEYIIECNPSMRWKKIFYGGCGGCIFRVDFFRSVLGDEEKVRKYLELFCDLGGLETEQFASDAVISFITYINGGTIGQFPGFCETHHANYFERQNNNSIEVLHQFKSFYD